MDNLIKELIESAPNEIFFIVLGAIILLIIQKLINWIKLTYLQNKIKKEIQNYKKMKKLVDVIDLVNGVPELKKENIFFNENSHIGVPRCLFIDLDSDNKKLLNEKEIKFSLPENKKNKFFPDQSFNGKNVFDDIADLTKINNLPDLIEKHRRIVGNQVVGSYDGFLFNKEKFGIYNLSVTRIGDKEDTAVEIELFRTDYFTHRVFRSIYEELKEQNHPIRTANGENFLQYCPFFTSFGLNTLLICEGVNGKEIVLSKRSPNVFGKKSLYHITMNEGLNSLDIDSFGSISVDMWLKRGLEEELGINEELLRLAKKSAMYDIFLDRNKFEIGITSVVILNSNFSKDIEPLISKDKNLEFTGFETIPIRTKNIHTFVKNNEFIPHGLYTLDRVLLREKIYSTSILIENK